MTLIGGVGSSARLFGEGGAHQRYLDVGDCRQGVELIWVGAMNEASDSASTRVFKP